VVVAELAGAPAAPLVSSLNYSYNVAFAPTQPGHDGGKPLIVDALDDLTEDLRSEGLLRNAPIGGRPNKALGYDEGELPGFALPPPALTDLRILHGSCRRPAFTYPDDHNGERSFDGFAWIDDLIVEWRRGTATAPALDANVRPHQLFLTGDQIYADDVSSVMLPMLNRLGLQLIASPNSCRRATRRRRPTRSARSTSTRPSGSPGSRRWRSSSPTAGGRTRRRIRSQS
jgi:hypothetical protein